MLSWGAERCFEERRQIMEEVGELYRAVRKRFGDAVEIRVVNPRNFPALYPVLFGGYHVPFREALRALFGIKVNTVILNGRLVSKKGFPDPEFLVDLVRGTMSRSVNRSQWRIASALASSCTCRGRLRVEFPKHVGGQLDAIDFNASCGERNRYPTSANRELRGRATFSKLLETFDDWTENLRRGYARRRLVIIAGDLANEAVLRHGRSPP
jgi:hypothetical protein